MKEPLGFSFGDKELPPFNMRAGETVTVEVEWDFTSEAHAKDWSVTAFGDGAKGTLHLTHDKGIKSDSWHPIPRKEEAAKKAGDNKGAQKPDTESEASFVEWLEALKIDGAQCTQFKEDRVQKGEKQFIRVGIISKCPKPVAYAVQMYTEDWFAHMSHAYKNLDIVSCKVVNKADDIQECIIQLTPQKPLTGWQLSDKAYGVQNTRKLDEAEL